MKYIKDALEFAKNELKIDPMSSVKKPRYCKFCNRVFIPITNRHTAKLTKYCHVCDCLLYPAKHGFCASDHEFVYHKQLPGSSMSPDAKEYMWNDLIKKFKRVSGKSFPYNKKFKHFDESNARFMEASKIYTNQLSDRMRARRTIATCRLCGEEFRRRSYNSIVCPRCNWLLGTGTDRIRRKVASGEYTQQMVKAVLQDKLNELDPKTRERVLDKNFNFGSTEVEVVGYDRAAIIENIDKHRIIEKPIIRCKKCQVSVDNQEDLVNGLCQTCRDSLIPTNTRWFKGIVGLSNRSLEDIAKLPSYCHGIYTKHMTPEELEQFDMLLSPHKKEHLNRLVMRELSKISYTDEEV